VTGILVITGAMDAHQRSRSAEADTTEEPYDEYDNQHGAKHPAESGAAIAAVSVVAATTAENQNYHQD
jgi:hypothetical protein